MSHPAGLQGCFVFGSPTVLLYLALPEASLQLPALLLQSSDLLVLGEQRVSVLGQISGPLSSKGSLVLLHCASLHWKRAVHLQHRQKHLKVH